MDNAQAPDRLQDLYLTGVRSNGKDIGVGAYGKVYEVEYCGTCHAASGPLPQLVPPDQVWQTMTATDGPALPQVVPLYLSMLHAINDS